MKIKTLTTYDVYNYGASLQAYALQKYLSDKGHDVEVIKYQPDYLSRKYDYSWVNPESVFSKWKITRVIYRICKFLQRQTSLGRKKKFDYFNHNIIKETKKCYTSFDELCNDTPEADVYIVGSDQVWNVLYDSGRDPSFYLEFVKKGDKVSYAPSFSFLDIDEENLIRIWRSLSSFKAISVREKHGLEILDKIKLKGEWVLDPVFLLDNKHWITQMIPFDKSYPYVLVYDFEGNKKLKNFVKKYAKKHKLKIISIVDTYPQLYANKNYTSAGPREFLTLIYNCDAFISNSFHGTAFSILFHKTFYVFSRNRHKVNSRMQSLLSLFHLDKCLDPVCEQNFDWNKIDEILQRERKHSKDFLTNALRLK